MRRGSLAGKLGVDDDAASGTHQRSVDHVCDSAIASRESRARHRAKAGRGAGVGSEGPRQAGQGRGRVQQQRPQPQPAARPAQLPRGVDGRVGLHRGARDRGLPRRRRHGRRAGGAAAHGAVRDPGPAAVAAGRPGPPGAGADPGLHAARVATGAAAVVVGLSGPTSVVYALAVLSTIAATLYRPAHSALLPVAVPHRVRAGQRQRGPRAAGLRGHAGGSAAGRGAAPGRRCDGGVRVAAARRCGRRSCSCGCGTTHLRVRPPPRTPAWCAPLPRASARSAGAATWR